MNEIRELLLDCRTALRRADRRFAEHPLRERLDQAIVEIGEGPEKTAAEPQSYAEEQVALAWQQAARDLHFSHPALYQQLVKDVRERLQADELLDPGPELKQLQARCEQAEAAAEVIRTQLSQLQDMLARAVQLDAGSMQGGPTELAQRRIDRLLHAATGGGGLPRPRAASADEIQPTIDELRQVSQGQREFTREEREWCIGEAVVRSQFERNPTQLLADGDRALARLLLDGSG